MRKGRLVVAGAAVVIAGFLLWWCGHKGGGGVHPDSAPTGGPPAATKVVDPGPGAAAPASIGGRVTDAKGAPIEGAIVRLSPDDDDGPSITARSGADGGYAIDDVAPGRYAASASAPGFLARAAGDVALAAGEHRALDVALAAGGRPLSGTVADATGGPIGGVLVEAEPERGVLAGAGPDVAAALTDDKGRFALTVAEGSYRVRASHAEYVGATRRAEVGPGGATVDFALVPGGAIEGTVEDAATGQGVAGARVQVEREAVEGLGGGAMAGAHGRAHATADGAGHFRVGGLEPGTIAIRATAPGRASVEPTVVPLGVAEVATGVIVVVQAAPSVSGTVVDDAGAPAPRAEVYLTGEGVEHDRADASGAFTFEGVKPGRYQLTAGGGGFLDAAAPVAVTVAHAPVGGVKLVVRRGAMIRGHVDPPAVAHVEVPRDPTAGGAMDLHALLEDRVSTDAGPDGAFSLGPVEPGAVDVVARAADGRRGRATVQVAKGGADGVVIHLAEGAVLAGRVTDGKDPVAGAVVTARRVKGGGRTALIVNGVDVAAERAPTGADGAYRIAGLDAGDYDVQVLDERGAAFAWRAPADKQRPSAPVAIAIAADEHETADLEVERPHGVIKGVVLGADGQPVADAWVSASRGFEHDLGPPPGAGAEESSMMIIRSDEGDDDAGIFGDTPPVLTGADGRFELAHLRRGTYTVLAEGAKGRSRGSQDGVEPDAEITIRLADLTTLSGTVTANGAPVSDVTVELAGPVQRSQRFLAAHGQFTMQRIDPGTYDVTVSAAEGTGHAQVVVASGQDATVAVALVGHARVSGTIVDASGAPIAGAPVVTVPDPGASGKLSISVSGPPDTTAADGTFAIDVEPGKRLLVVLGGGGPVVMQPIDVKSGDQLELGTITAKPHAHPPGPPGH